MLGVAGARETGHLLALDGAGAGSALGQSRAIALVGYLAFGPGRV